MGSTMSSECPYGCGGTVQFCRCSYSDMAKRKREHENEADSKALKGLRSTIARLTAERDRWATEYMELEAKAERMQAERDEAVRERDELNRAFDAACKSADRYREALKRIRDDAVDSMRVNTAEDREAASQLESARQSALAARPSSEVGGG